MGSHFQRTVLLQDWWLTRAEKDFQGKSLAVAGPTPGEQRVVRIFISAPIVKRYDCFTLETADGICIVLQGCLNKQRTSESGFSSEVFKHFLFGFSPCWEEFADNRTNKEPASSSKSADLSCHRSKSSVSKSSVKNKLSSDEETPKRMKFNSHERSSTNEGDNNDSTVCPKSITPKYSRSAGRRLLPPLEFWRNQIPLYNMDGSLRGIQEEADVVKQ